MAMKVGFIGLGKMGLPMTVRLLGAGFEVHVFNRSRAPVEELAAKGAVPASSAADVAERAEIVLTALPTPEAVEQVFREMMQRAHPVFRTFGKNIKLCGPAGAGQVVKLINQLLVGVHTAAVAEAAVFGAKLDADPRGVLEVIGTSFGGSTMMTRNLPRFISRDFGPATSITLLLKDLGLIHDEAKAANVPLFLGAVAEQRFLEARARGMGENDMASLVRLWEEAAGVTVDKPRS